MVAQDGRGWAQFLTLALLYLFAAAVHVATLWNAARFPHLSTDEAQYTMVGENLRLGKGYTIRGQFHSGIPPIYPLFVAAVHSVAGSSRHSVLCFNCLAMCLGVFPVFLLARRFRLSLLNSYLMSMAAAFLPHTFYAAMYMAESLQYPLILTAFYLAAKWLDHPFLRRDIVLGSVLGAGLLNKFAELSFLIALLLTVLILGWHPRRENQPRRAGHTLLVFGMVIALELAWMGWKSLNGAGALGTYGTALEESAHATAPIKLLLAYAGDFFLASGLIIAVPLFYWFRDNWQKNHTLAILLGTTLACQLGIHGFIEARLTGMVRERLFLYSFPLIAIAAVAGMERFQRQQPSNIWGRYVAPYAPLLFVLLVSLYNYPLPSPAVEAPWAGLLGSYTLHGYAGFANSRFALNTLGVVLIAATLWVIIQPRRNSATVLAAFLVLFHVGTFLFVTKILTSWSRAGVGALQPLVNWLSSSGVKPGDSLFIAGASWAFEGPGAVTPVDEFFQSWVTKEGLPAILSVQLEALARYDVRLISGPAQIPFRMKPGQPLLIDTRISHMDFVSESYPYYLYKQPLQPTGPPRALYTIDISPAVFATQAGRVRADAAIAGTGDGRPGVLAISGPMGFIPGRYRLTAHVKNTPGERCILAVNLQQTNQALARFDVPEVGSSEFNVVSEDLLNFSLYGKSTSDFLFEGLTVQFVSAIPGPVPPMSSAQTQHFVAEQSGVSANPLSLGLICHIDGINGMTFGPAGQARKADGLHLLGWAFDRPTLTVGGTLQVELVSDDNRAYYAIAQRGARLDVAAGFHTPALAQSGFRLDASLQEIPAGWYRVYLIQMQNGQPDECSTYSNVIVEE